MICTWADEHDPDSDVGLRLFVNEDILASVLLLILPLYCLHAYKQTDMKTTELTAHDLEKCSKKCNRGRNIHLVTRLRCVNEQRALDLVE